MILGGNPQENETKLNQLRIIFPCPGTPAFNQDLSCRVIPFLVAVSGASCAHVMRSNWLIKMFKLMLPNATSIRSLSNRDIGALLFGSYDQTTIEFQTISKVDTGGFLTFQFRPVAVSNETRSYSHGPMFSTQWPKRCSRGAKFIQYRCAGFFSFLFLFQTMRSEYW